MAVSPAPPVPPVAEATVAMTGLPVAAPSPEAPPPSPPASRSSEAPTMIVMRDLLADVLDETNAPEHVEHDVGQPPPVVSSDPASVAPPADPDATQPLTPPAAPAAADPPTGGDTIPFASLIAPTLDGPSLAAPSAAEPTVAIPRPEIPPVPKPLASSRQLPGRWVVAGVAGVLGLVLLVALVLVGRALWSGGRDEPSPAIVAAGPSPTAIEPAPEVAEPVEPLVLPQPLVEALDAIARKRWLEARRALGELEDLAENGELSAEVWTAYRAATETVELGRCEVLLGQLDRGLGEASTADLERTLRTMVRREENLLRASVRGADLIDRARASVQAAAEFEAVMTAGAGLPALEQALRLETEIPALAERLDARTRAASSIDAKVSMLMEADRLEEARAVLVALDRLWPNRPGTAQAVASIDSRVSSRERYEGLLAQIETAGRSRPHEGLAMLEGVAPPSEFRARFEQLRDTLVMRFADLDREPPQLELVAGQEIEYKKGQPIVIELRATDDYDVVTVGALAMVARETVPRSLPVVDAGDGRYRVEIEPTVHDDRPLVVWFRASDRSGHETRLGSQEHGLELRRKRWFDGRRERDDGALEPR